MGFGLPKLSITFQAAAEAVNNRSKQGVVGLILRDAGVGLAGNVYTLTDADDAPSGLGADNLAVVESAFEGSELGTPSKILLAVVLPEEVETDYLGGGLEALTVFSMDYLSGPPDLTATEANSIQTWTEGQREKYRTVKAVLPETTADNRGVIDVSMAGVKAGSTVYTSAQLCPRVAGILAGIPSACSATGVSLPEITFVPDSADPDAEVDAGKLILIHDGLKARIGRAVNSLVTVPTDGKEAWKKIKIVEGMDLITYFLRTSVDDSWRGKYANSYDNQCLLLVEIRNFFTEMEGTVVQAGTGWAEIDVAAKKTWLKAQGVETSGLTDQQIREYASGSEVFIAFGCTILDAMEDFTFSGNL